MPKVGVMWIKNAFLYAEPQEKVLLGETLKYICNILSLKQTKFGGSQSPAIADTEINVTRSSLWMKQGKKKTQEHDWSISHSGDTQCDTQWGAATFASEPQTEGFPNVSPIQGLLVFMLQCLSVL